MIIQTYLSSINEGEATFCLDYLQDLHRNKTAILLISGFSEPLCDMDYYMSKMAKYLYKEGNDVIQMDLFAHGDSTGASEEITINKLMNSITDVVNHILSIGFCSMVIVSRGLIGTVISDCFAQHQNIIKILVLNPWYYSPDKSKVLQKVLDDNAISFSVLQQAYCKDLETLPSELKDTINVYSELGVFNQIISQNFFYELLSFDYSYSLNKDKSICFETNGEKNDITPWKKEMGYREKTDFDYISLVNNAIWQFKTYKTINSYIKGVL